MLDKKNYDFFRRKEKSPYVIKVLAWGEESKVTLVLHYAVHSKTSNYSDASYQCRGNPKLVLCLDQKNSCHGFFYFVLVLFLIHILSRQYPVHVALQINLIEKKYSKL